MPKPKDETTTFNFISVVHKSLLANILISITFQEVLVNTSPEGTFLFLYMTQNTFLFLAKVSLLLTMSLTFAITYLASIATYKKKKSNSNFTYFPILQDGNLINVCCNALSACKIRNRKDLNFIKTNFTKKLLFLTINIKH